MKSPSQPTAKPTATILVIDDDPFLLTAVAAALHLMGYESHCARDREAAMKGARSLDLDLIICDIDLGEANGLDLCREIRELPERAETPVIFVSGVDLPDLLRRTREAGGTYFLRKPYDPNVLLDLVEKALWMPHLMEARIRTTAKESISTAS